MEAEYNSELLTSNSSILQQLESNSEQEKVRADNLYTTFNSSLQRAAYDALSATGLNGAVVVLEPDTGKILPWFPFLDLIQIPFPRTGIIWFPARTALF